MELANCLLALGGDRGNTVPKHNVTPAEIAVMCHIHGVDAVFDIEPLDSQAERSNSQELERLLLLYPAKVEDGSPVVRAVYPGRSPVLHTELVDLGLPEEAFRTIERAAPTAKKTAKKTAKAEKPAPVGETAPLANDATHLFDDE